MAYQRHNTETTLAACRRALALGCLIKSAHDQHWRFRGRLFHCSTVNTLIAAGEAFKRGGFVYRSKPHADSS
jgi:hypothetical protein